MRVSPNQYITTGPDNFCFSYQSSVGLKTHEYDGEKNVWILRCLQHSTVSTRPRYEGIEALISFDEDMGLHLDLQMKIQDASYSVMTPNNLVNLIIGGTEELQITKS